MKKQHGKALKLSKVRPFVLYSLRHAFLTRLGQSGCDVWTLRVAGHSSIAISARYVHPSGELHKDGEKIALPRKAFEILRVLAERPGEVVTREDLRAQLWAADTFVEFDDNLNHAVNKLRQVLSDSLISSKPDALVGLQRGSN